MINNFFKKNITLWDDGNSIYYKHYLIFKISETFKKEDVYERSDEDVTIQSHISGVKQDYLEQPLSRYFNINYKDIESEKFKDDELNLIYIPCISHHDIIFYFKNFPEKLLNFAKQNKVKILLSYIREHPELSPEADQVELNYKKYCLSDDFKSKYIKILVNGFEFCDYLKRPNVYYSINTFDRIMRNYIESGFVKTKYKFLKKRKYDFSLLFGMSIYRPQRILFFLELIKHKIIDDRFFYTMICLNQDKTKKYIMDNIDMFYDKKLIMDNIDVFLNHKVYGENGLPLKNDKMIYYEGDDFKIPNQIVDSYINIVFESRYNVPSLTEKIYKPIICGVPFIWMGPKNTLKYLKSKGYKPYPFINYTFDIFDDINVRKKFLLNEISRLKNLNLEECINECKDISEYNRNIFFETSNNFDDLYLKLNERL